VMVIVKKPGVDVPLAERGLYGGKIHGQTTILTNGGDLSELSATGGWGQMPIRLRSVHALGCPAERNSAKDC
jgi:hypothetical protein